MESANVAMDNNIMIRKFLSSHMEEFLCHSNKNLKNERLLRATAFVSGAAIKKRPL